MTTPLFGSLVTAMVTPFAPDGAVDYARTEQLVDRLIADGTETILVAGTTGESPTLTHHEKVELFKLGNHCVSLLEFSGIPGDEIEHKVFGKKRCVPNISDISKSSKLIIKNDR